MYLKCSNNNEASTVLDEFLTAITEYGLPSRVHCDKGGENTAVFQNTYCCILEEVQGELQ